MDKRTEELLLSSLLRAEPVPDSRFVSRLLTDVGGADHFPLVRREHLLDPMVCRGLSSAVVRAGVAPDEAYRVLALAPDRRSHVGPERYRLVRLLLGAALGRAASRRELLALGLVTRLPDDRRDFVTRLAEWLDGDWNVGVGLVLADGSTDVRTLLERLEAGALAVFHGAAPDGAAPGRGPDAPAVRQIRAIMKAGCLTGDVARLESLGTKLLGRGAGAEALLGAAVRVCGRSKWPCPEVLDAAAAVASRFGAADVRTFVAWVDELGQDAFAEWLLARPDAVSDEDVVTLALAFSPTVTLAWALDTPRLRLESARALFGRVSAELVTGELLAPLVPGFLRLSADRRASCRVKAGFLCGSFLPYDPVPDAVRRLLRDDAAEVVLATIDGLSVVPDDLLPDWTDTEVAGRVIADPTSDTVVDAAVRFLRVRRRRVGRGGTDEQVSG